MTNDDLRDLLDAAAGTPPRGLDPDALLATAGRRRNLRVGGGLLAGAAAVTALALVVPPLLPTAQVAVPAATASAKASVTAAARGAGWGSRPTAPPGCSGRWPR